MNIGIVTYWYERGAAYVSKQFEDVLSIRHNVYIYARGGEMQAKNDPNWDHPNVHWSKHEPRYYRTFINKNEFTKWVKKNSIDAVIFNEQTYFEPILWCEELGVKSLAYIDYYTEETIPLFGAYDALICNTQRHCSAFDIFDTVYYLPWGTDTDLYSPIDNASVLVEEGKVTFFNSAGMNPKRKGTDIFIKALERCSTESNIKALVHSQKPLKKQLPQLADTIQELQDKGILELVEKTITAPGLYTKADVYVYPSRLDGIGLTVPEAISSGLACIVSDNPPMNEFVLPEFGSLIAVDRLYSRSDGYYWPQCRCNINDLAEIMKKYAQNLDKVQQMKINARTYALSNLSAKKNFIKLLDIVEAVRIHKTNNTIKAVIHNYDRVGLKRFRLLYSKSNIYNFIPYKVRFRDFYNL